MQAMFRPFALLLFGAATLWADDSLAHARQAQAMLGPDVWSQVISIENTAPHSPYPRTLHAVVFELEGLLWFYTDTDGTQSFSLKRGRLAEEKADYGPLLRDIEPGFTRWSAVRGAIGAAEVPPAALPNGCFIQSVAATRALGGGANHLRLLSYYVQTPSGLHGHTVLAYSVRGRVQVFDPQWPNRAEKFSEALARDALTLARMLRGDDVVRARLLPLDGLGGRTGDYEMAATAGEAPKSSQS
jgi:hypothetical protein